MSARYRDVSVEAAGPSVEVRFRLDNESPGTWRADTFAIGWQFFDPETNRFIMEGAWQPLPSETKPGESAEVNLSIPFPPEPGSYRVYVSPIEQPAGWAYARGEPFLSLD